MCGGDRLRIVLIGCALGWKEFVVRMNPIFIIIGFTEEQFRVHNAESMIKAGFQGKGIHVGVIDAGFTNCDVIPYFEGVNIFGYHDFVRREIFFG